MPKSNELLEKRSAAKAVWLLRYLSRRFNSRFTHSMNCLANWRLHTRRIEAMQMMP